MSTPTDAKPPEPSNAPSVTAPAIFDADIRRSLQERRDLTMAHVTRAHVDRWRIIINMALAPAWKEQWTFDELGSHADISYLVKTHKKVFGLGNQRAEINGAAFGRVSDELATLGFELRRVGETDYVLHCIIAK